MADASDPRVRVHVVEPPAPGGRLAYNPSIVDHLGKTFFFYRFEHASGSPHTRIAVCELDATLRPIAGSNRVLALALGEAETLDDPRALVVDDALVVSYVRARPVPERGPAAWATAVAFAEIGAGGDVLRDVVPVFGHNWNRAVDARAPFGMEKSWTPFAVAGRLHALYSIDPTRVLAIPSETGRATAVHFTKPRFPPWTHGAFLGGGTPLLRKGDSLVGFFHSHTRNGGRPTYHVGYFALDARPPFPMVRRSARPLFSGEPDASSDGVPSTDARGPNVVYPCGFVDRGDRLLLSYGWNDRECRIAEIPWGAVLDGVVASEG